MPLAHFPILGRLGNIFFQVAYALKWCEQNHYTPSIHMCDALKCFALPEIAYPDRFKPDVVHGEHMYQNQKDLIYTRSDVKKWFAWKPKILERLRAIDTQSHPFVLNVRQGGDCQGTYLPMISDESYRKAATDRGYDINRCHWEKDTNPTRLPFFDGDPNGCGRGTSAVSIPSFYRLQQAPVLFRAASTFAWWAATLGDGKVYSPVIDNIPGGTPNTTCDEFVLGNFPRMTRCPDNSDLHLNP